MRLDWFTNTDTRTGWVADQKITNQPNQQYRISVWVKKSDPDDYFEFHFQLYDDLDAAFVFQTGPWWQIDESADPTNWHEWTCENVIFCEDVAYMGLYQYFGLLQGTIWVDDVSLTEMEDATFPLTDLSLYNPPAEHPVLWDPKPAWSNIAVSGESAQVPDADGTVKALSSIRGSADSHVMSDPDWTSGWDQELGTVDRELAYWLRYVAHVYTLTGDDEYLQKVRDELLAWAGVFGEGGSNVTSWVSTSKLNEQRFILWTAEAYDDVYEGLSADDRQTIETDFLRPLLRNLNRYFGKRNNRYVRGTCVTAMVGLVLRDMAILRKAFHSLGGLDCVLRYNVGSNGGWLGDASSSYVNYTFDMWDLLLGRAWDSGINQYEIPKMVKVLTFLPRIVFPDGSDPAYGDGAWANYAEWEPYEAFKEREPELAEFEYISELFSDLGYAILREGEGVREINVGFTYGLPVGHAHPDRLGLILYGNDQVLAPDAGTVSYTGAGSEIYFPYLQQAVSHNLVTVDEKSFERGGKKNLQFHAFAPGVKVISASTDEHYPGVLLHRTLTLTRGYVLDLFRCNSDDWHRYDWIHNNFGDLTTDQTLERWRGPVGFTGGYFYVPGVGSARTQGTWTATWDLGMDQALRLLMAGGSTTEIIAGESPRGAVDIPVVFARRRATNTVFVATLDPYQLQPKIVSLSELRASSGRDDGVGAAVTRTNGVDYFALSGTGGSHEFVDRAANPVLSLDGSFGAMSWEQGEFGYVLLVEGTSLVCSDVTVTSGPASTVYAEMVSNNLLRVENMGTTQATVTVHIGTDSDTNSLDAGESFDMTVVSSVSAPAVAAGCWPQDPAEPTGPPPVGGPIPSGVNLVTNPSMEESEDEQPVGWTPLDLYPGIDYWDNDVAYVTNVARTATHSLNMKGGPVYDQHSQPGAWVQECITDHGSNTSFRSSAWAKADQSTQVRLCLYGHEPGWGTVADGAVSPVFTVGTNWTQISHITSFGPAVSEVSLVLARCAQWQGGEVWFDDVEVMAVDPADLRPEIENLDPSDITWNSATLSGNLFSTGGAPAEVWIYWGTNNAGTDKGSWQTNTYIGGRGEGVFSNEVHTLTPDATYYYRCYGSNINGGVWAEGVVELSTAQTNECIWTGESDQSTWTDSGNWQPSSGYPGDSGDKATIPSKLAHAIHTGGALTIGQLEMQTDCSATITLGGALTISGDGVQSGDMIIAGGTFYCNGNDLIVATDASVSGTLDAHSGGAPSVTIGGSFTINSGGAYGATSGTTTLLGDFDNYGAFTHNDGTVTFSGGSANYYMDGNFTGSNAFYNLSVFNKWCRPYDSVTIEHDLTGTGPFHLKANPGGLTLGTSSYASQVTISALYGSGATIQYMYGADESHPAQISSGTFLFLDSYDYSGYAPRIAHVKWIDVGPAIVTAGGSKTIALVGECEFGAFTVSIGDELAIGTNNATFRGDLTINGTNTVTSGTITCGESFTNNGVFSCGTSTMVFTNGGAGVDNNSQAFHNLTAAAGVGNTVTLAAGTISAISNLLHVVSGTCQTDASLSRGYEGDGTFVLLPPARHMIVCGEAPLVELGATLKAGDFGPSGSLFKIW